MLLCTSMVGTQHMGFPWIGKASPKTTSFGYRRAPTEREKTPHGANQIKRKCCVRQIRLGQVRALLFGVFIFFFFSLHPLASNRVKFTAVAAHESDHNGLYCCAELSSQAFVSFDPCDRWGGPTSSFVGGHIAASFWTGLPLGGDPFVHHGVSHTEDRHELELSLSHSLVLFLSLCLPAHSSVLFSDHPFTSCPSICANPTHAGGHMSLWSRASAFWTEAELPPSSEPPKCVLSVCEHTCDREKDGGPELIVQTQFLRLPLWNQELWMDITPLTSETQRGTDLHGRG